LHIINFKGLFGWGDYWGREEWGENVMGWCLVKGENMRENGGILFVLK